MKKQKILISLIIFAFILMIATISNAAEVTTKTELYGANKSLKITIEGVSLDATHEYKFGITKNSANTSEEWMDLYSYTDNKIEIILTPENDVVKNILRSVNEAYITIKDLTEDNIKLTATKVNLQLPYDESLSMSYLSDEILITYLYGNQGMIGRPAEATYYINILKVDDKNIIKKYLNAKEENKNTMDSVKEMLSKEIPKSNWKQMDAYSFANDASIYIDDDTKYEGLYLIWGQVSFKEGRSVYGYMLYDNYPNGYKLVDDNNNNNSSNNESNISDESKETQLENKEKKDVTSTPTTTKKDTTTATFKTLPNTGLSIALIGSILLVIVGGVALLAKYHKYRDIK